MGDIQRWLASALASIDPAFMQTRWGWPAVESVHFLGLTLLFGAIAVWDLRLVGMARHVPIAAFHRLVPVAIFGFGLNAASGSLFLMAEPDQYIYNPAFHVKLLFLGLAGLNVLLFYLTIFRRVSGLGPGAALPRAARIHGAASLVFWGAVIICGRLITFYRPWPCQAGEPIGFLADCILR